MRFWLHSTARTPALGQSTLLSVVTHVVLIGGAVYSTGVNARELGETILERIAYYPPPDRRPSSAAGVERIHFVDVGFSGAGQGQSVTAVKPPSETGTAEQAREGAPASIDDTPARASVPVESRDSVYSVLEVEEGASRMPGSAAPIYPPELIKGGKEGSVFIRFVVDTTGRADSTSIEVIRATNAVFAQSVRDAVPFMAFRPAQLGGHAVRQSVEQNFEFKITQPLPIPAAVTQRKTRKPVP
jgi:TonB family protein